MCITELFLGSSIRFTAFFIELPSEALIIRGLPLAEPPDGEVSGNAENRQPETFYWPARADDLSISMTVFRGKLMIFTTVTQTGRPLFCLFVDPPEAGSESGWLRYEFVNVTLPIPFPFMVNFTSLDDTSLFASGGVGNTDFIFRFVDEAFVVQPLSFQLLGGRNANSVCSLREDGSVIVVGGLTEEKSCTTRNDPEGTRHSDVIAVYPESGRQAVLCSIPVGVRSAPGVALLMDRFVIAFGGYDGKNDRADLFLCDLTTGMSSTVRQVGSWPSAAFSSALILTKRRLYILSDEFQGSAFYITYANIWRNIEYAPLREEFGRCLWTGWKSPSVPWKSIPKLKPNAEWLCGAFSSFLVEALTECGVLRL